MGRVDALWVAWVKLVGRRSDSFQEGIFLTNQGEITRGNGTDTRYDGIAVDIAPLPSFTTTDSGTHDKPEAQRAAERYDALYICGVISTT